MPREGSGGAWHPRGEQGLGEGASYLGPPHTIRGGDLGGQTQRWCGRCLGGMWVVPGTLRVSRVWVEGLVF